MTAPETWRFGGSRVQKLALHIFSWWPHVLGKGGAFKSLQDVEIDSHTHKMVVNLVLPWRLKHITCPGRNPLLPIHQYFHLKFGKLGLGFGWNYWQICWQTFPRCGMVGFPFDPGSVRLHLMLPFLSLLVSWVYTSLVHSNELSWNALQLNSNSNVSMIRSFLIGGVEYGQIPAKAFARERMTCPVPSVKLTRQVQGAVRWKKT